MSRMPKNDEKTAPGWTRRKESRMVARCQSGCDVEVGWWNPTRRREDLALQCAWIKEHTERRRIADLRSTRESGPPLESRDQLVAHVRCCTAPCAFELTQVLHTTGAHLPSQPGIGSTPLYNVSTRVSTRTLCTCSVVSHHELLAKPPPGLYHQPRRSQREATLATSPVPYPPRPGPPCHWPVCTLTCS